jgi:cytochrome c oxidase assembly protein subunit 15
MRNRNMILSWLILSAFIVVSTLIIGGYTRLTNSGLSIVEWKPIAGVQFPLSKTSWNQEFDKYKESPEYKDINSGMSLEEFKSIYTIEYIHRMIGRLVGMIFFLPLCYFLFRGYLEKREIEISIIISALILLQGFVGWYMVSSGIVDMPFVNHFRLSLHLIIAVIIYSLIFWLICRKLNVDIKQNSVVPKTYQILAKYFSIILIFLILVQIFVGGLVAGSKAGFVYNTFPRMAGRLLPSEIWNFYFSVENLNNIFYIQFFHRAIAYIIAILGGLYTVYMMIIYRKNGLVLFSSLLILISILCQIALGVLTLLYVVPLNLALLHQLFSIILLSIAIWNFHIIYNILPINKE